VWLDHLLFRETYFWRSANPNKNSTHGSHPRSVEKNGETEAFKLLNSGYSNRMSQHLAREETARLLEKHPARTLKIAEKKRLEKLVVVRS
jgi:hypothetical protein